MIRCARHTSVHLLRDKKEAQSDAIKTTITRLKVMTNILLMADLLFGYNNVAAMERFWIQD
ncbi:MAG: hypothetical protein ACLP5H_08835 [Desulfomonilaceae bacterium]